MSDNNYDNQYTREEIEGVRKFLIELYSKKISEHTQLLLVFLGLLFTVNTQFGDSFLLPSLNATIVTLLLYALGRLIYWSVHLDFITTLRPWLEGIPENSIYRENLIWAFQNAVKRRIYGLEPYEKFKNKGSLRRKLARLVMIKLEWWVLVLILLIIIFNHSFITHLF